MSFLNQHVCKHQRFISKIINKRNYIHVNNSKAHPSKLTSCKAKPHDEKQELNCVLIGDQLIGLWFYILVSTNEPIHYTFQLVAHEVSAQERNFQEFLENISNFSRMHSNVYSNLLLTICSISFPFLLLYIFFFNFD